MLFSVIGKSFFVIPADSGDVESVLVDLPLAVSRLHRRHVVRIVFEDSVCVIYSGIEAACILIVYMDAFRYSREFNALGLSVICERSLIVPPYA